MNEFLKQLRERITGELPPDVELHLERSDFIVKMLKELNGQQLLDLLESGEWRICERMGLCNGYCKDNKLWIDVPYWNHLVAHLQIVNSI